ncbi:MAG: hypothetical protein U0414_16690 [Polyangiaceae bacterium]
MKSNIAKYGRLAVLGTALAALAGCLSGCGVDPPTTLGKDKSAKPDGQGTDPNDIENQDGNGVGNEDNTFDHMASLSPEDHGTNPWEIAAQRQEEGPPEIRTRMHSCQKMQIATLRNILTDLGVDLSATAGQGQPPTAGQLLNGGGTALGQANYAARAGEAIVWTAAGAAKQFDIFVQAAPEIIANIKNAPACQVNGSGPEMFNADDTCNEDAITCIIGKPATSEHVAICNNLVTTASNVDKGKAIAVAAMLSAAHSCE